jgi:2-oxoglutarate dehydrogenase E2 component (dihydrolipoamide succinyltransferase)
MSAIDVVLERETANDESAIVVMIHVAAGTEVRKGEPIFDIENSKATQEVVAPESGILSHTLQIGQTVGFGVAIARILAQPGPTPPAGADQGRAAATDLQPAPDRAMAEAGQPAPPLPTQNAPARAWQPRFSRAALALMDHGSLAPTEFETDFVTADDVRARLGGAPPRVRPAAPPPKPPPAPVARTDGEKVARSKAAEIASLGAGAGQTMLSVLGATVGPLPIDRPSGSFLDGTITDLVIYEASRLMRRFSRLNAFYVDGQVCSHAAVHAGLAIDSGGRLVVCGLQDTDRASLGAIQDAMADAVARYLDNRLSATELTRATFTVTDLSASDLDFVLPLLPQGQSCIIGITHGAAIGFRLFVGFDHRVTEGREAGLFLDELKQRLQSYRLTPAAELAQLCCADCGRTLSEAAGRGKEKGLLKIIDRDGRDSLCCMSCWNGW